MELPNLDGLSNLTSIGDHYSGVLVIKTNQALTQFCGLHSLLISETGPRSAEVKDNGIPITKQTIIDGGPCYVPPEERIHNLAMDVQDLVTEGVLNQGNGNALISKLENSLDKLERGKRNAAINQMGAFINQVQAFINSGKLTVEEGKVLIDTANEVIESM